MIPKEVLDRRLKFAQYTVNLIEQSQSHIKDGDWLIALPLLKAAVVCIEDILLTREHSIWKDLEEVRENDK